MKELTLDGALGMEAIHHLLREELQFPDYYGNNLDALFDMLTQVREDVQFRLVNLHGLGRRGPALQMLLQNAAEVNPHIRIL